MQGHRHCKDIDVALCTQTNKSQNSKMEEELLTIGSTAISGLAILLFLLKKVPRTKGENIVSHIVYLVVTAVTLFFCPEFIQNVLFSQGGVVVVGTIIPIYESIIAVVSIDEADDVAWLQFWIVSGIFTYCTEWMDIIAEHYPSIAEHWYEFEFFAILWLLLPFTDGSAFLFHKVTQPLLAPIAQSFKSFAESKASLCMAALNSGYLWVVWFTFLKLDEEARRFIVIAVGTLYPIAASSVACTTKSEIRDDTFWLTYWACYSILFLMMDYLENFIGSITGFYSICLCITVYLFLPMFQGADAVFRNILVPLTGQYEQMLLKDLHMVKVEMERKIPKSNREATFGKALAMFTNAKKDD